MLARTLQPIRLPPHARAADGPATITLAAQADGRLTAPVPAALRGRWCRLSALGAGWCALAVAEAADAPPIIEALLALSRHGSTAGAPRTRVLFLPPAAQWLTLRPIEPGGGAVQLRATPLSPAAAVLPAVLCHPMQAARALWHVLPRARHGLLHGLRTELARLALSAHRSPGYAEWAALFDAGAAGEAAALMAAAERASWPAITALVFHAGPAGSPALRATLAALAAGPLAVPVRMIGPADPLPRPETPYVALLQAGELLPPHALPLLAAHAASHNPDILLADQDRLDPAGRRMEPQFRPRPSRTLMLSGTLSRGLWLVRSVLLPPGRSGWAEAVRLEAWLRLHEAGRADRCTHVPRILTHRRHDTEAAPAEALAAVARAHLRRTGFPGAIQAAEPLRLTIAGQAAAPVSLIVPSTLRAPHVRSCLGAVLRRTAWRELEIIVVVGANADAHHARWLVTDPRVRVVTFSTAGGFNYAAANNAGARQATGELLCLLNDDVRPLGSHWLRVMAGHLADPAIGVVGARLLYPDHTVQHAGIVLRPDGTGVHAHRGLPRRAAGPDWRAVLTQEVAAVTGACLLTPRALYQQLDGLDESFASAFNDIDYCLRARAAGRGVVLAAEAELIHHESLTYARHYGAGETARAAADRARMLARWGGRCTEDPFHSPNLSREPAALWHPAFPPRTVRTPTPCNKGDETAERREPALAASEQR